MAKGSHGKITDNRSALRKKAEDRLKEDDDVRRTKKPEVRAVREAEMQRLVHELQVHEIELELQNEELQRANAALEEAQRLYQSLYEFSPVGYFTFDREGIVREVNLAGCTLLGYERRDVHKAPFSTFVCRESLKDFFSHLDAVYTGATDRKHQCELWLLTEDKRRIACVMKSALVDRKNASLKCYSAVMDITDRKRMETDIHERTKQLETANNELESFSYTVSHDLRAPLRAIDGFSRMILKKHRDSLDHESLERLKVIRANIKMMGQLIDGLLTFSRLSRGDMSVATIDMADLVANVWREVEGANRGRDIAFAVDVLLPAEGDVTLIRQVVVNLLSNAVKFTRFKEKTRINVGSYGVGDEVVYSVRDNGAGFDMAYAKKLFGVFSRLHSSDEFEGTGVGLAIVQRIVMRHGGRVWAEGKDGEGATFYFTLPFSRRRNTDPA